MKKKITNNLDLKILAILFSIILWLIVVNIDDPVKSVQFSGVEVQILHADKLTDQGKVYEVLENTDTITVTVKGRRSIVEDISKENISAVADMKDLTSMDTLSITVSSNKYANEIDDIKADTQNVKVNIENLRKIQKLIQMEVTGEAAKGYILGDLSTNMNQVYLEGPESLIKSVSYAKAELDVDGVSSSISASIPIHLYDVEDNLIDDPRIKMNVDTVSVNQEVLVTKFVPIDYKISGIPAEGYAVTGEITSDVTGVTIAGKKAAVDAIGSIAIPEEVLDVTDAQADTKVRVNLEEYLPGNVIFADKTFKGYITVVVEVEKETFITILFDKDDIVPTNLPEGLKTEVVVDGTYVTEDEILLRVYGLADSLSEIDVDNIVASLDFAAYMEEHELTELKTGTYTLEPDFGFPEGAYLKDVYKVSVKVSAK